MRDRLGIAATDPLGGQKFLNALQIDAQIRVNEGLIDTDLPAVSGAVLRQDLTARIGLLQAKRSQRRFTAARAAFAAWADDARADAHLLTQAVTREQQANRAFAAEIMAPKAFLRKQGSKFSRKMLSELAEELDIGVDVVRNQVMNNGMAVV